MTATSTLELGVDIAHLEAVIILGFPGSVAKLWQRAGRCGRDAHADALCVVVAYPSAIDQWVMRHPARMLARPLEAVVLDAANPVVVRPLRPPKPSPHTPPPATQPAHATPDCHP